MALRNMSSTAPLQLTTTFSLLSFTLASSWLLTCFYLEEDEGPDHAGSSTQRLVLQGGHMRPVSAGWEESVARYNLGWLRLALR